MNFKYYKTIPLIVLVLTLSVILNPISECIENWIKGFNIGIINKIYNYNGIFSTVSLLMIILRLINKYLWKYELMNWLINLPNLNGRYEGELISSYQDEGKDKVRKKCVIEIVQDSSKIKISSYYSGLNSDKQTSCSYSVSEEIVLQNDNFFKIYYIYDNKTDVLLENLSDHSGTCELQYYPNEKRLKGEYYNKRVYKRSIDVVFKSKNIKGKL